MDPLWMLIVLFLYFGVLLVVSYYTSRKADNQSFFLANKSAPWYLVAFGMIGTSLSGVTFVSVPGTVGTGAFAYFQVVIGYFIGYFIVAFVLLPLYYKLNLTSIYNYLLHRLGIHSYKTGALLFIVSRTLGATLRLYLVINVLQLFVLDALNIPFALTTAIILLMIVLYTFKGGVKTIVWTDTLQTFFMLLALVVCVGWIIGHFGFSPSEALDAIRQKGYTQLFVTDPMDKKFFLKQIIGGVFVTVSMTGLDQEMMQKNISVKTLRDAQKNMLTFSTVMVLVNLLFLGLGGMLYLYAGAHGINATGDDLFPTIAMQHLPGAVSILFIIGLISALFPSADGAITALTSSWCIDILDMQRRTDLDEKVKTRLRQKVHLGFTAIFLLMVFVFKWLNNKDVVNILLDISSYTYGPLLGLFAFGIVTRAAVNDRWVPWVCLAAPALVYTLDKWLLPLFSTYKPGLEVLLLNGGLTFLGLWFLRARTADIAKTK
jgi:Na+/proline symporter